MSAPDIPKTLGALLIGGFFASVLAGMVNIQTVFYFRSYTKDPMQIKSLIFVVWSLDTLHSGFIWAGLWFFLIRNYGQFDTVDFIPWSIALTVIMTALVTFLVHCFFAHRIFLLSKRNWFMTLPVIVLTLLRLVAASVSTWEMLHYHSFPLFRQHARWIFTLGLSVSSAVDILITGLLVYLFQSNRTGSGRLNHLIDKWILYGLETGSLTCLGTIASMLCWVIAPQNLVFLGLHLVIGKLYANSLLVTLNMRKSIQQVGTTPSSDRQRNPVVFLEPRAQKMGGLYMMSPELQINVETHTNVQFDGRSMISDK
ncbi:hypothetical protein B0H11DRAFT_1964884 [Mycena galericulata]|nr:hypothetical protein B0H11DRAFT_1964884 [Mycena galericulata]